MLTRHFALGSFVLVSVAAAAIATASYTRGGALPKEVKVSSPDGKNTITVALSKGSAGAPTFAVARSGRAVVDPSAFKISLAVV
jgi:hypothetical protein